MVESYARTNEIGYIIGHRFIRDSSGSIFNSMQSDIYIAKSTKLSLSKDSQSNVDEVERDFHQSLRRLAPKCQTAAETEYVAIFHKVANSILSDSPESISSSQYDLESAL